MTSESEIQKMVERRDIKGLLKAMSNADTPGREAARKSWRVIGNAGTVQQLILLLEDADSTVRYNAAHALGIIGDKCAVEPLINALRRDKNIRTPVAIALGILGDPQAVEPLVAALQEEGNHGWVPQNIIQAIGKLADPRAADVLVGVIEHEATDTERSAVNAAVEALIKIADPRTIEPLTALLHQGNFDAGKVIMSLRPPTDPLTQAWCAVASRDWKRAVDLGQVAIQPLIKGLETFRASFLRVQAASALGQLRLMEGVEALIAALRDNDIGVRAAVADALGEIGDPRAIEPLITCLRDVDEWPRRSAARALGKIGDPKALNSLSMASRDSDLVVRDLAQEAIQAIQKRAPQS